jgi:lipopolysaccharide transport system permease protein
MTTFPPRSIADLYRFRELIQLLVARDLKVRYKRSILGMLWTLLNPLLQMVVYTLVFSRIMRISVPGYPVFVLAGLLPWGLISVSTLASSHSLLANQGLIRKVAVPQAVYPMAVVGSKLVDMVLSLVPLAILAAVSGLAPGPTWLFLVPAIVIAAAFTTGLALLFSSLTVFFRDVRHLIDILFQVWFYLTPIIYPAESLERLSTAWVRHLLAVNPATPIVRLFHDTIYARQFPSASTVALASFFGFGTLALGLAFFTRFESRHIHHF